MNKVVEYDPTDKNAPYQQQWFPGVHGSVGGGGDYTGLSDEAIEWGLGGGQVFRPSVLDYQERFYL